MVLMDKRPILFTDELTEATYRCESCGTEAKRTMKTD